MINKKGMEIGGKIVMLLIALMILGGMIYAGFKFYKGEAIPFINFSPSFNRTSGGTNGLEIIGYRISDNSMNYYSGNNWESLSGTSKVGDKVIIASNVQKDIEEIYYRLNDPYWKYVFTAEGYADRAEILNFVKVLDSTWVNTFLGVSLGGGSFEAHSAMRIDVDYGDKGKKVYIIDYYGKVFLLDTKTGDVTEDKTLTAEERAIFGKAIAWRDGVLPSKILVYWAPSDPEKGSTTSDNFCLVKVGEYLRIDLSKPVSSETTC